MRRTKSTHDEIASTEAMRVVAMLRETLKKLAFLGTITPDVVAHREELSMFVGDEISQIIKEQRRLELRYQDLIAQRSKLKGLANKSKYKENQAEIEEVSRALRESTKSLCRNLKDNPNISGNLVKVHADRSEVEDLLRTTIEELSAERPAAGHFSSLSRCIEATETELAEAASLRSKESEARIAVAALRAEIEDERLAHDLQCSEKVELIADLKRNMRVVEAENYIATRSASSNARSSLEARQQEHRAIERTIEAKCADLEAETEAAAKSFELTEKFIIGFSATADEASHTLHTEKEHLITSMDAEIVEITELRAAQRSRLDWFEERKAEEERILAEETAAREKIEAEAKRKADLESAKHLGAEKIVAELEAYVAAQALAAAAGSGAKKGKKKGKGKKKKGKGKKKSKKKK